MDLRTFWIFEHVYCGTKRYTLFTTFFRWWRRRKKCIWTRFLYFRTHALFSKQNISTFSSLLITIPPDQFLQLCWLFMAISTPAHPPISRLHTIHYLPVYSCQDTWNTITTCTGSWENWLVYLGRRRKVSKLIPIVICYGINFSLPIWNLCANRGVVCNA